MAESSQLTQGGSKVRRLVNQLLWEGSSVQNCVILTGISEQPNLREDFKLEIKKKHWVDFYQYRMDVYILPTHIYDQITCKVNFASTDPFKIG